MTLLQRALARIVDVRKEENVTMWLMFSYSFLAMAGYNVVKPATRSQFIDSLGADNLPYVQLVAGLIMGFVIQGYASAMNLLPRRWVFAATQAVMVGLLLLFWMLFQTGGPWVSVAFYLWGVLAGSLLLISQFWSLANVIFDPRQAKRLFGFIGGGASLGGIVGAGIAGNYARAIGTNNLLLVAGAILGLCFVGVWAIAAREKAADPGSGRRRSQGHEPDGSWVRCCAIQALPGHCARHQLRRHRCSHRRTAAQHVGQAYILLRCAHGVSGQRDLYSSIVGFIIQMTRRAFTGCSESARAAADADQHCHDRHDAGVPVALDVRSRGSRIRRCAIPSTRPRAKSCSCRSPPS
jgi:MFS family permease